MLDPRQLLLRYNQAAEELNSSNGPKLAVWSPDLLQAIGVQGASRN